MRALLSMTCLSLVTLLTACDGNNGYYDKNGNYIPPANTTHDAQRNRPPAPGGVTNNDHHARPAPAYVAENPRVTRTTTTTYTYDRAGYYDYNGYYIAEGSGLTVPKEMFPPNGMCRVWFTDRLPENQPNIESCNGINYRVPAGAYVIYGG
jgi:hypothetical protein